MEPVNSHLFPSIAHLPVETKEISLDTVDPFSGCNIRTLWQRAIQKEMPFYTVAIVTLKDLTESPCITERTSIYDGIRFWKYLSERQAPASSFQETSLLQVQSAYLPNLQVADSLKNKQIKTIDYYSINCLEINLEDVKGIWKKTQASTAEKEIFTRLDIESLLKLPNNRNKAIATPEKLKWLIFDGLNFFASEEASKKEDKSEEEKIGKIQFTMGGFLNDICQEVHKSSFQSDSSKAEGVVEDVRAVSGRVGRLALCYFYSSHLRENKKATASYQAMINEMKEREDVKD